MLSLVIEVDQETWTRSGKTVDVQMDEGVCLALCHEWCTKHALRKFHDLELFFSSQMPSMHRIFTFQRGFNLVSDSLSRNANYANYFQIDEGLTTSMVTKDARRSEVRVSRNLLVQAGAPVANALNQCYRGETFLLGFWGVDQGENWGHVIAVSWPPNKALAYYFDPNYGLYKESSPDDLGDDVVAALDDDYDLNTIRD
ncbi:MAG TPA: hypothetical protein VHT91_27760, partial [Kofleriaceae bacterium]|nr:hypothetical protein [Kofleriaceae bacterium]